ncbi:pentatricopeptide repeat-containing protein 2, mitochondrial [Erpetoichthys calabaricus]|uniref:pentatricopeptide repeat-containing protein 2, mitochondrial n=1 Tax=Erpetoichthys calabaricus TaxID=27687 RepID=UPI0022342A95|nr:pentatricopeptide repeat-containing protein 2, mitochondrial [Erpetoichthys calabaricus]
MAFRLSVCRIKGLFDSRQINGLNLLFKNWDCWRCQLGAKRHLLSDDVVRLQEFQQRKIAVIHQLAGDKGQYFQTIEQKLQRNNLILKDELKLLLHLCQTPADVEVAKKAVYRYHEENKNFGFGEFKFGPLFMRLCYELGLEETATQMLKDQALKGFFLDSTSFNIVMDMLFIKGYYDSALEILIHMKNQGVAFSKDTYTLGLAVCYKLNTNESCQICTSLIEETQLKGKSISRHAYCFAVALALKLGNVEQARSIYLQIMNTNNNICLNLNVFLMSLSGELNDVLSVLQSSLVDNDSKFVKRPQFCQEVLFKARENISSSPHLECQFEDIFDKLSAAGQITNKTLDEMLCHTPYANNKHTSLFNQRSTSRRTLRPLQSTLLSSRASGTFPVQSSSQDQQKAAIRIQSTDPPDV